jgi:hypothetical protein
MGRNKFLKFVALQLDSIVDFLMNVSWRGGVDVLLVKCLQSTNIRARGSNHSRDEAAENRIKEFFNEKGSGI